MRKIITTTNRLNKKAILYIKTINLIRIIVILTAKEKIKTYWFIVNKKKKHEWYINKLKENHIILNRLKINGCAICGYDTCNEALEFHHVIKNKKFMLNADNMYRNDNTIIKELNKCILLCANCHKEIHAKERLNIW